MRRPQRLRECVQSLAKQTFREFELALFGFLQRFQPQKIVVLTDGGSEERIRQSRAGLDSIGLEATYLNFAENDFYVALLRRDVSFFETVADLLYSQIATAEPHQIFCDAIEFYNPVHDITLPLVLRAADANPQATLFEVPLFIRPWRRVSTTRFSEFQLHLRRVVFVII